MREFLGRKTGGRGPEPAEPKLSFGSWGELPAADPQIVVVCHPDWRGVKTAAYTFGLPVVECADLERWGHSLIDELTAHGVQMVVLHGFPPGAGGFLDRAHRAGIGTGVVLHSSMAQHGAEIGEAVMADEVLALARSGVVGRVGFAKAGIAESLQALGYPASYVPNRAPPLVAINKHDLGPGLHIGVFAEPFWRKNVVTQLGAIALLDNATAHVMSRPEVGYLDELRLIEHRELPRREFLELQASTDLNLYVTLSECHPLSPIESYLSGVPALISRTSSLFRTDPTLWELSTVEIPDDPSEIAAAATRLLENRKEAMERARRWIEAADADAAARWQAFVAP
jgi:hypothetical protein